MLYDNGVCVILNPYFISNLKEHRRQKVVIIDPYWRMNLESTCLIENKFAERQNNVRIYRLGELGAFALRVRLLINTGFHAKQGWFSIHVIMNRLLPKHTSFQQTAAGHQLVSPQQLLATLNHVRPIFIVRQFILKKKNRLQLKSFVTGQEFVLFIYPNKT